MIGIATALPKQTWLWIYMRTMMIMGFLIVGSVFASVVLLGSLVGRVTPLDLTVAIVMPIFLGGPLTLIYVAGFEKLRLANRELLRLATVDGLTGILNRRAFSAEMESQSSGKPSSGVLLVVDADHFKTVNDSFGHDQGDEALRRIAQTLEATVGNAGVTGRLGGEEFGIYLPHADLGAARQLANQLREAVAHIVFAPAGTPYPLSVSIGGARHEGPSLFRDLFRRADEGLYGAKQAGRNRVAINFAT